MDKKEILVLEDSAVAAWNVGSPSITVNLLKDGAIDLLKNLANFKIISFAKPAEDNSYKVPAWAVNNSWNDMINSMKNAKSVENFKIYSKEEINAR